MKNCIPHIKEILIGVTYAHAAMYAAGSFVFGVVVGWYVKGRGMTGVKIDLANVKTDIENIKAKLTPVAPTV